MRTFALQDESAAPFIEHLSSACEKLLAADFSVKTDSNVASGELAILRHLSPGDATRCFVIQGREQVPGPIGLILNFPRATFFDLAWNANGLIEHVFPGNLNGEVEVHRLCLEHASEVR